MTNKSNKGRGATSKRQPNKSQRSQIHTQPGGYTNTSASSMVLTSRSRTPSISTTSCGVRVRNTERCLNSVSFTTNTINTTRWSFNPCSTALLAWLPGIARCYAQYRVHSIKWSWVPRCSVTNGSEIQMGLFYDWNDAARYVSALAGGTQMDNLADFAYGAVWQGGPIATSENSKTMPTNWLGVIGDTKRIHARVPFLNCSDNGLLDTALENQIQGVHLVTRTFAPTGEAIPNGQIYVSYDVEFIHPTISASQAPALLSVSVVDDSRSSCWQIQPDGSAKKVDCLPKSPAPTPTPLVPPEEDMRAPLYEGSTHSDDVVDSPPDS